MNIMFRMNFGGIGMPWYIEAKREIVSFNTSDPKAVCPDCGSSGPKAIRRGSNNYYCWVCWMRSKGRDPGPEFGGMGQPIAQPIPVPSPQPAAGVPSCKMCGQPFGMSKLRPENHFCWNCYKTNGINVEMKPVPDVDPNDWMVAVSERGRDGGFFTSFKGTYGSWMAAPSPMVEPPPVEIPVTEPPRIPPEDDDIYEIQFIAAGDYANGQPEANVIEGGLRIFSRDARKALPIDDDAMLIALDGVNHELASHVEDYLGLQDFLAMRDDPLFKDIQNTPVLLDDSAIDPVAEIEKVASSDLFSLTEIGGKGLMPNISQSVIIDRMATTDSSMTICLPTGAGKTTCAEAAIAKGLSSGPVVLNDQELPPAVMYLAPARALSMQVASDFSDPSHPFYRQGWGVRMMIGNRGEDLMAEMQESSDEDPEDVARKAAKDVGDDAQLAALSATREPSIIVGTPEKLLSCITNPASNEWVNRVKTYVFDEGHLIGDPSRGPKFEAEQMILLRSFGNVVGSPGSRIVFMSATMDNAEELVAWQNMQLGRAATDIQEDPNQSSRWILAWGDTRPVKVVREYLPLPSNPRDQEAKIPEILARTAGERLMKRNPDGTQTEVTAPSLMFVHRKTLGQSIKGVGQDMGIDSGFYHAKMPRARQRDLINRFGDFQMPVLSSTSCLAAGVNVPAWNEAIIGASRGPTDVSVTELGQMAGRAGRQSYARILSSLEPEIDPETGEPIPLNAKVTFYLEQDRYLHHRRRIDSGSYLSSTLSNPTHLPDVLLLLGRKGMANTFEDAAGQIGSTFAYFQAQVDNSSPVNVRRGLERISKSVDGNDDDLITWDQPKTDQCAHMEASPDYELSNQDLLENGDVSRASWHVVCKQCGATGTIPHLPIPKTDEDFILDLDGTLRDLIGCGFMVYMTDPATGKKVLKVTELGQHISRLQVDCSSAVDNIKNMANLRREMAMIDRSISDAPNEEVAYALAYTRANGDEDRGAYLSDEQAMCCQQAHGVIRKINDRRGGDDREVGPAAVKAVQCLIWVLDGISINDVANEFPSMISDYVSVAEAYGGTALSAFEYICSLAGWFSDSKRLDILKIQLSKMVGTTAVPFAVADQIGAGRAAALAKAGFKDLNDVANANIEDNYDYDDRWAMFWFYLKGWDKKTSKGTGRPLTVPDSGWSGNIWSDVVKDCSVVKNLAAKAVLGVRAKSRDEEEQPSRGPVIDRAYRQKVETMNSPEMLETIRRISRTVSSPFAKPPESFAGGTGWYRRAKTTT